VPESGADDQELLGGRKNQRLHQESAIYNITEYLEIHGDLHLEIARRWCPRWQPRLGLGAIPAAGVATRVLVIGAELFPAS
jgi:hypothetical protein